jgi:hypothetical protein
MRRASLACVLLGLIVCCVLSACTLGAPNKGDDVTLPALAHTTPTQTTCETTPEVTTPEETTPEETTPAVTEPDFENGPDSDGTKRY